ncbi:hypothetical protein WAI453_013715 [Rhynchosporium graminicola]
MMPIPAEKLSGTGISSLGLPDTPPQSSRSSSRSRFSSPGASSSPSRISSPFNLPSATQTAPSPNLESSTPQGDIYEALRRRMTSNHPTTSSSPPSHSQPSRALPSSPSNPGDLTPAFQVSNPDPTSNPTAAATEKEKEALRLRLASSAGLDSSSSSSSALLAAQSQAQVQLQSTSRYQSLTSSRVDPLEEGQEQTRRASGTGQSLLNPVLDEHQIQIQTLARDFGDGRFSSHQHQVQPEQEERVTDCHIQSQKQDRVPPNTLPLSSSPPSTHNTHIQAHTHPSIPKSLAMACNPLKPALRSTTTGRTRGSGPTLRDRTEVVSYTEVASSDSDDVEDLSSDAGLGFLDEKGRGACEMGEAGGGDASHSNRIECPFSAPAARKKNILSLSSFLSSPSSAKSKPVTAGKGESQSKTKSKANKREEKAENKVRMKPPTDEIGITNKNDVDNSSLTLENFVPRFRAALAVVCVCVHQIFAFLRTVIPWCAHVPWRIASTFFPSLALYLTVISSVIGTLLIGVSLAMYIVGWSLVSLDQSTSWRGSGARFAISSVTGMKQGGFTAWVHGRVCPALPFGGVLPFTSPGLCAGAPSASAGVAREKEAEEEFRRLVSDADKMAARVKVLGTSANWEMIVSRGRNLTGEYDRIIASISRWQDLREVLLVTAPSVDVVYTSSSSGPFSQDVDIETGCRDVLATHPSTSTSTSTLAIPPPPPPSTHRILLAILERCLLPSLLRESDSVGSAPGNLVSLLLNMRVIITAIKHRSDTLSPQRGKEISDLMKAYRVQLKTIIALLERMGRTAIDITRLSNLSAAATSVAHIALRRLESELVAAQTTRPWRLWRAQDASDELLETIRAAKLIREGTLTALRDIYWIISKLTKELTEYEFLVHGTEWTDVKLGKLGLEGHLSTLTAMMDFFALFGMKEEVGGGGGSV